MPPTVFISLDAILTELHEAAFRTLFALRRFGSMDEAQSRSEALVEASVAQQLSLIVSENRPCFVVTSLHLPDVDRQQMQEHMKKLGLATIGENLAEHWSTGVRQSCTQADEISAWLANYAGTDVTYAIIDVEEFGQQIKGTRHWPRTVVIDSERRSLSGLASAVDTALCNVSKGSLRA